MQLERVLIEFLERFATFVFRKPAKRLVFVRFVTDLLPAFNNERAFLLNMNKLQGAIRNFCIIAHIEIIK